MLFTVTVSGGEEMDGEAPFLYVVSAPDDEEAMRIAGAEYERTQEREWTSLTTDVGLPESGYYNDLRPEADAAAFFYVHAGWNYDPATETIEQGRRRCARELADAENWAHNAGYSFGWSVDPHDTHTNGHVTYVCVMYSDDGEWAGSLGGVDLGEKGTAEPYARVIQAELAADQKP